MLMLATIKLVGSIATLVAAMGSVASVIGVILALRRVQQVHVIVNSANTALRERVEQLAGALQASGVEIPKTPSEQARVAPPAAPPSAG
jgi:flagellar motor component MotA